MACLPDGEKISKIFIRFGATHERVRQTDGQTDRLLTIAALCIASHGKNKRKTFRIKTELPDEASNEAVYFLSSVHYGIRTSVCKFLS